MREVIIDSVIVLDRGRKDFGDLPALADSIRRLGQLQPIVLDSNYTLLAGERRLRACKLLGQTTILATFKTDLTEVERKEIELEENLRRKDLTWPEQAILTREIHDLKQALHGSSVNRWDEGWSLTDTAALLTANDTPADKSTISRDIQVAKIIEFVPALADAPDRKTALKRFDHFYESLKREKAIRSGTFADEGVLLGDVRVLLPTIKDASVSLVVMDPPYGIDLQDANAGRYQSGQEVHFDDSHESVRDLLPFVYKELRRILVPDGHLYTFCAIPLIGEQMDALRAVGFDPDPIPLVWIKNRDSLVDYAHRFAGNWEPIIFCKGRSLSYKRSNVFTFASVESTDRLNVAEKPTALLAQFIQESTVEGEVVLDPFGGSGATAAAAKSLGRKYLTIEQDQNQYNGILQRLNPVQEETPTNEALDISDEMALSDELVEGPVLDTPESD